MLRKIVGRALSPMIQRRIEKKDSRYVDRGEPGHPSPGPGTPAPNFRLELIDAGGTRTGEIRALTDHLDKPVALIFGSYT